MYTIRYPWISILSLLVWFQPMRPAHAGGGWGDDGSSSSAWKKLLVDRNYYYAGSRRIQVEALDDTWVVVAPAPGEKQSDRIELHSLSGLEPISSLKDGHSEIKLIRAKVGASMRWPAGVRGKLQRVWLQDGLPLIPSDRVFLKFKASTEAGERKAVLNQLRAEVIERLVDGSLLVRVEADILGWANRLRESGLVEYAEPDLGRPVKMRSTPKDPFFPRQWHLLNTGQDGAKPGAHVDAPGAWEVTTGSPEVIIAIIDTGVDPEHEDLDACKLLQGYDAVTQTSHVFDTNGHGTSCAGVAAARANNAKGVAGACPACRVLPIRIGLGFDAMDLGNIFSLQGTLIAFDSHIARAFFHAVDQGAWVISNSWGPVVETGPQPLTSIGRSALDYARTQGRGGLGAVVLFAAGNEGSPVELDGWASHQTVMAIGASNDQDRRSGYSNYGASLSLVAPSNGIPILDGARTTGIWTTDISGPLGYNAPVGQRERLGDAWGNYTSRFGGTSSATPLAAGIAALVLSVDRSLTAEQVQQILEGTAVKIDPQGGAYDANGFSQFYGHGRVDARVAVERTLAERGDPETGDTCSDSCGGANPVCVQDAVFGDYCTHACSSDGDCPASYTCREVDGSQVCARPIPCDKPPELCNGLDDDGNQETDEGCEYDCSLETFTERCDGEVLQYCDSGYQAALDCAAINGVCAPDSHGIPRCDFECPEQSQGMDIRRCAGDAVVACQYRETPMGTELAGISVTGCAEGCHDGGDGPQCVCAGQVDVCEGDVKVKCVAGVTQRFTCENGCDDSRGVATCTCGQELGCDGDRLTMCNGFGQVVEIDCPERCEPEAGELKMPDCGCSSADLDETGTCAQDTITYCNSGETVTFQCPEACAIGKYQGLFGEYQRAMCTCENIPAEGTCEGNAMISCPLGFRLETQCLSGCGWVLDAKTYESHRGCLCEGMQAGVACDGGEVVACLSNGDTIRAACSEFMPGTDTCVLKDIGDQDPFEVESFECVKGGTSDGGPTDGGQTDGGPTDGGGTVDQDGHKNDGGGCGCRQLAPTATPGIPAFLLFLFLVLVRKRPSTSRGA